MLRTMITDEPFEQRWVLQGRLSGQWAVDVMDKWEETRSARRGRMCVVDLEDVVSVDETGERALLQMATEGARMITSRAYMKHILGGLKVGQKSETASLALGKPFGVLRNKERKT